MVMIKDVVKLVGVVFLIVFYVLNGDSKVSVKIKVKVLEVVWELNYCKNGFVMDLKWSWMNMIVLILIDFLGLYYLELICSVQDVVFVNGYDLIVCSLMGGCDLIVVWFLWEKRVDGVIIFVYNIYDDILVEFVGQCFFIIVMDCYFLGDYLVNVLVDGE